MSSWNFQNTGGVGVVTDKQDFQIDISFTNGDGDNEIDAVFHIQATLPTREEHTYDLAGGVTDAFGNTLTFAEVKELTVYNQSTTDGDNLLIGGIGSATTGALLTSIFQGGGDAGSVAKASGHFSISAPLTGFAVTGGSADILSIYNNGTSGGGITYDLIVKGVKA